MTTAVLTPRFAPAFLFRELDRPSRLFEHITPNWFASVMGTGIVANAAATLPFHSPIVHTFATVVWGVAATALLALTLAFAAHWSLHTENARRYAAHPVVSLFYGAIPMALLTVGVGTLLVGKDVIGLTPALWIDGTLWAAGTIIGLGTALRPTKPLAAPLPALLMPVVPPMVSATAGALLLHYIADGWFRAAFSIACYALFALGLVFGTIAMVPICRHLFGGGTPPLQAVPTVWITLGLVGQSITAANLLGADSGYAWLHVFGVVYGVVISLFGIVMFTTATAMTIRAARTGLRFSLTWWSFTFPVGTCVTGATALGAALGSHSVLMVAVALYILLFTAWVVVAANTLKGTISGRVFLPV